MSARWRGMLDLDWDLKKHGGSDSETYLKIVQFETGPACRHKEITMEQSFVLPRELDLAVES